MYYTPQFKDPVAKAEVVAANMADMITNFIEQGLLNKDVSQSEIDTRALRLEVSSWIENNPEPTFEALSDYVSDIVRDYVVPVSNWPTPKLVREWRDLANLGMRRKRHQRDLLEAIIDELTTRKVLD